MPGSDGDDHESVVLPSDRLIAEDDVEAIEGRRRDRDEEREEEEEEDAAEGEDDSRKAADDEGRFEAGVSREDLDLVRLYLKPVGKRKLLTAKEEQEIGQRIEEARGEPCRRRSARSPARCDTLLSLAAEVKKGAPAAELILLLDGGELKTENASPRS